MRNANSLLKFFFSSKIIYIVLLIGIIFIGNSVLREFRRKSDIDKELSGLKSQIADLYAKKNELMQTIENFNKESYLEKEARTRFNLAKPGEKLIIIVPPEEESAEIQKDNNLNKIWEWIRSRLKMKNY